MRFVRALFTLLRVVSRVLFVAGLIASVGAVIYALQSGRGQMRVNSFDTFPDVPVNPAADRAA
jgi:hypothetical protein